MPTPDASYALRPPITARAVTKKRWLLALLLGTMLWLLATVASQILAAVVFDGPLLGWHYGVIGVLQAVLGPMAIMVALHPVGLRLRDLGLTRTAWRRDAAIGAAVATTFALIQFLVVIPATGGAQRSDIVVNAAQIGDSLWGVIGFIVLAWAGAGWSEELFFRGHWLTLLEKLLGTSQRALILTTVLTTVFFALLHGYQGWSGVIDTGLYGGLTLTLLFLWRKRLTACMVAHALWNTFAIIVIYFWY